MAQNLTPRASEEATLTERVRALEAELAEAKRELCAFQPNNDSSYLTPKLFRRALRRGESAGLQQRAALLRGRICQGNTPIDFETLMGPEGGHQGRDPGRICSLLGADGLEALAKSMESKPDMPVVGCLLSIGYSALDIYRGIVKKGSSFTLVVMSAAAAESYPATWDGLLGVLCESYPEMAQLFTDRWAELMDACGPDCENFNDLEAAYIADGFPNLTGLDHSHRNQITATALMELHASDQLKPFHLRAWLFSAAHIRKNFRGDGYTWLANNERGNQEWLMQSKPTDSIEDHVNIVLGQPREAQLALYICDEFKKEKAALEIQRLVVADIDRMESTAGESGSIPWRPTPAGYIEAFRNGAGVPSGQSLEGLCGRVCRGKNASDFLGLAELSGERKVVFMLGADGLEMVLQKHVLPLDILLNLGYDVLFLYEEIKKVCTFRQHSMSNSFHYCKNRELV